MNTSTFGGETGVRGKEFGVWVLCCQINMQHKAQHQKGWPVEGHNAPTIYALQRGEVQVIKGSLCTCFSTVSGLVAHMHAAFVSISDHIAYQLLLGLQPHVLPPLEGGYHGDFDVKRPT